MIYPCQEKLVWDLFITLVLFFSCIETPYRIAFVKEDGSLGLLIGYSVDLMFFIDIILTFNSAIEDNRKQFIDDRKVIAALYLKGWFLIDFLAIVPIDIILSSFNYNEAIRLARIGRLYKLVKINKLMRVFKMMKEKSNLVSFLQD